MPRRMLPRFDKPLRATYEAVIIGAGVHGLGLAFNLAKRGMTRIAVFEKSYLGSGASGRNTTLIRSAFSTPEWIDLMQVSVDAWQGLSHELDLNVMFTRRGYMIVATSEKNADLCRRAVPLQNSRGVSSRLVDAKEIKAIAPCLDTGPILAGVYQSDGGIARHDAVVWGYAAQADKLGVDIFPYTEVTGIDTSKGQVTGVSTSRGDVSTPRVINAAGGHSPDVARLAGIELPAQTYPLEAFVTEPLKPMLDPAMICLETLTYLNQTARGEFVCGSEPEHIPPSRSIKSSLDFLELTARNMAQLIPALAGASILRQWAGLIDMTPDLGPLLGESEELKGFCLDCGWGGYGFMASPGAGRLMAEYIVTGVAPPAIRPFAPNRFALNKPIHEPSLVVLLPDDKKGEATRPPSAIAAND